jgi:hypothetical protein
MGDPTYSALQILNERFAKGETEAKYEEKRPPSLERALLGLGASTPRGEFEVVVK